MKTRIISAAVLLPLFLIVIWVLPKLFFALLLGVMAAIGAYELLCGTGLVRHMRLVAYSMAAAFAVSLWCYLGSQPAWGLLGLLVFVTALFAEMMANHVKLGFDKVALCVAAGALVPYLFSALVRIHGGELGRQLIVVPLILTFVPDSGAYFAGRFFGKHKLAPVISPKKTVEGAIGGAAAAVVGMLVYALVMSMAFHREVNYGFALVYGIVGSAASVFGDLMFSVIKRQTGIKDYGNLIPGHGGILDRFDSMMMVAPLAEVLLILLPAVV